MRLEWKREAIARAKHEYELERQAELNDRIQLKQGEVLSRCIEENGVLNLKIVDLEEDVDDMRPWMKIGKSVVVVGSVALVGWTTIQLLNVR